MNVDATSVTYPLMESFYTIQGEGMHVGRAAWFIRLGGCDVECVWCDVKDSWNADAHPKFSVEQIVKDALQNAARFVVITGGEPSMYDLTPLTEELKKNGIVIAIETSGSHELQGTFDWICLSPKKFKAPLISSLRKANELKVVIYNKTDFAWAEQHAGEVNADCNLLLQPEHSRFNEMMPMIVDYVKTNPRWRISLQTHKIIGIP